MEGMLHACRGSWWVQRLAQCILREEFSFELVKFHCALGTSKCQCQVGCGQVGLKFPGARDKNVCIRASDISSPEEWMR